jgi:glycosyltransferase involved in cell wall biosynthesis
MSVSNNDERTNPVLMLVRNSLELTKISVGSVLTQDIPTTLWVVNNDSDEATTAWLKMMSDTIRVWNCRPQLGVSRGWNMGLEYLFETAGFEHVLVVNNDVTLRQDCYRELLKDGGGFVTAVSVGDPEQLAWDGQHRKRPHPDFSCYLIRREVWERVGRFDETMMHYASDADFHVRMDRAGIEAYTIGVPFFHYASGTLKTASEIERMQINAQADRDRETFRRKYNGVKVGTKEYYQLFNSSAPPPQAHVHRWQRRRDGRWCSVEGCGEVQFGDFSNEQTTFRR